jgi:hypothetical protein
VTIAIVGGGASGVITAIEILRQPSGQPRRVLEGLDRQHATARSKPAANRALAGANP